MKQKQKKHLLLNLLLKLKRLLLKHKHLLHLKSKKLPTHSGMIQSLENIQGVSY
jgi:hypothetical protein